VVEAAKQTRTNQDGSAHDKTDGAAPFGRLLVAIDESQAAEGAFDLVAEWVGRHGADARFVQVTEERRQRQSGVEAESEADAGAAWPAQHLVVSGPTLGARNRQLVHGIAEAAEAFGADVIVLGFDRPRLAGHRIAPSLREQIMRATELPVLVAPAPQADGKRHHRLVPGHRRDEERALTARRYAHV
jgi:nucleotide-binding universal stress UspA family protein